MSRRHKNGAQKIKTEDDDDDQHTLVSEAFSAFDRRAEERSSKAIVEIH